MKENLISYYYKKTNLSHEQTMNQINCVMYSTIPEVSNYVMDLSGKVYSVYTGKYVGNWDNHAQLIVPNFEVLYSDGIYTIEQFWDTCDLTGESTPDMIEFILDPEYRLVTRRTLPEYVIKIAKNMYNCFHGLSIEPIIQHLDEDSGENTETSTNSKYSEPSSPVSPGSPRLYTIPGSNNLRRTLSGEIFETDKNEWTPDMVKVGQFMNYKMVFLPDYHHLSGLVEYN